MSGSGTAGGGVLGPSLARRVARLEHRPRSRRAEWRSFLTAYFANASYDSVRDELVAALCSDMPHYGFTGADGTLYSIGWWDRSHAPAMKVIRRGSRMEDGLPPPVVRTYEGVADDV